MFEPFSGKNNDKLQGAFDKAMCLKIILAKLLI